MRLFGATDRALLIGDERAAAIRTVRTRHYTGSVPSGKSHYFAFCGAIVVFSIPANMHAARVVTGNPKARVWELTRLWAPDGHEPNLLTQAIAWAAREVARLERLDALVSYADPNAGHHGGVYQAASWAYQGQSTESRGYRAPDGRMVARRAFHSGSTHLTPDQIRARGYVSVKVSGKHRYARGFSRWAIKAVAASSKAYPKPKEAA